MLKYIRLTLNLRGDLRLVPGMNQVPNPNTVSQSISKKEKVLMNLTECGIMGKGWSSTWSESRNITYAIPYYQNWKDPCRIKFNFFQLSTQESGPKSYRNLTKIIQRVGDKFSTGHKTSISQCLFYFSTHRKWAFL